MKIIVSGYGGQGIKFLSIILAKTCMKNNKFVTMIPSYGPEARGGSSQCSLIIDDMPITNPVVKKADYLLAFSREGIDNLSHRAKNVIYHEDMNNMEMLGIFIKTTGVDIEPIIETMKHEISTKYVDRLEGNIANLKKGFASL